MSKTCIFWPQVLCLVLLSAPAQSETMARAKRALDGVTVAVEGQVTAMSPSDCYIEAPNRSSGIWVQAGMAAVNIGDLVSAMGEMSTINGERVISDANVYLQAILPPVRPLAMPSRSLGGSWIGYQDCASDYKVFYDAKRGWVRTWLLASGLNNTGLLVTTWGAVTDTFYSPVGNTRWFYMDDGYGATGDCGSTGVLVYSEAEVKTGQFVQVTGISSVECSMDDGTRLIRVVRPRVLADVAVLKEPEEPEQGPFTDEFDKPKLDRRWVVNRGVGSVSTAANPGWLKLVMPENPLDQNGNPLTNPDYAPIDPMMCQRVRGDWTLDVRIRADFGPAELATTQYAGLQLTSQPFVQSRTRFGALWLFALYAYPHGERYVIIGAYPYTQYFPLTQDTYYFRVNKQGSGVYISVSLDGVTWNPDPFNKPGYVQLQAEDLLTLFTYSSNIYPTSGKPFAVYVDHFRFSPPSQPPYPGEGGQ